MLKRLKVLSAHIGALVLAGAAMPCAAAYNVIPDHWSEVTTHGEVGQLRAGSPWTAGASFDFSFLDRVVDGHFLANGTQWNSGTWWWDQSPAVNSGQVETTIDLAERFSLSKFVIQVDGNDRYRLEYWDGQGWKEAWTSPAGGKAGLVTIASPTLTGIVTNRLRFTAAEGDDYYSVSEIQAWGVAVPEPATWALLLAGTALVGGAAQRSRRR